MRNIVIAATLLLFIPLWWITVQMAYKRGYDEAQARYVNQEFQRVAEILGR